MSGWGSSAHTSTEFSASGAGGGEEQKDPGAGASIPRLKDPRLRTLAVGVAIGALVLGTVILLGLRMGVASDKGPVVLRKGAPAPAFTLPLSTGETVTLASLRGQPVWLTFWATWCPPCRTEMPDLQEVYQASPKERYQYIAVNFGEDVPRVQAFLQEVGYTLPVALDPEASTAFLYQVQGLPAHFFIDEGGVLRDIYVGVMTRTQMERRAQELW